jgi:hypothetical protein
MAKQAVNYLSLAAPMRQAAHRLVDGRIASRVRIVEMPHTRMEAHVQSAPAELSDFLSRVLVRGLDIRAVWSVGNADVAVPTGDRGYELLAFADRRTLDNLRRSDHLHRADVELLVVIDGDRFENAWGQRRLSGSLARWAWRQVSPELAYYDESKWAEQASGIGGVVRVRRKAVLIWEPQLAVL